VARVIGTAALLLAALLCGCSESTSPRLSHDERTELRREQDCANPQWKAANAGLWYNVCPTNPF